MLPVDANIFGDWGTTNLRFWLVGADGKVLDSISARDDANGATKEAAKGVFSRLTGHWWQSVNPRRAILCGMVGRKGGWIEAPYLPTDRWNELPRNLVKKAYGNMEIFVVPGLRTIGSDDVMRGEETQILGLLDKAPGFTGTVCLPGTHSKWCDVSHGEITGFRTEMTGELFGLLASGSTLRDAILAGYCEEAFDGGVEEGLKTPDALQRLFSIRAGWLLNNTDPVAGYSRLSGLLIGAEIARQTGNRDAGTVALVGSDDLVGFYDRALRQAGISSTLHTGDGLVLRGLHRIAKDAWEVVDG